MENNSDSFRFTKHTAALLRGLGAPELIPKCRKRNISTDVLHQLSKQDFINLGVSSDKTNEIAKVLNVKRSGFTVTTVEDSVQHLIEIIKNGEQQLSLIQAFVAYCRIRLVKERINYFVHPNKCLSASQILPICVNATLVEVEEARKNLTELNNLISELTIKPKCNSTHRLCILISGLGLIVVGILKLYIR